MRRVAGVDESGRNNILSTQKSGAAELNNNNNDVGTAATEPGVGRFFKISLGVVVGNEDEMLALRYAIRAVEIVSEPIQNKGKGKEAEADWLKMIVACAILPIVGDIKQVLAFNPTKSVRTQQQIEIAFSNAITKATEWCKPRDQNYLVLQMKGRVLGSAMPEDFFRIQFTKDINSYLQILKHSSKADSQYRRNLSPEEIAAKLQKKRKVELLPKVKAKLGLSQAGEEVSSAIDYFLEKAIASVQEECARGSKNLKDPEYGKKVRKEILQAPDHQSEAKKHYETLQKGLTPSRAGNTNDVARLLVRNIEHCFRTIHEDAVEYVQEQKNAKNVSHATKVRSESLDKGMSQRGWGSPG